MTLPALLCALGAARTALAPTAGRAAAAPNQATLTVAGLGQPAQIRIDRWGVAHLYAKTDNDAFFVQGFNVARDRLVQLDLLRRKGLGHLSEAFGPTYCGTGSCRAAVSVSAPHCRGRRIPKPASSPRPTK
ncbi:penicillin acylase family protein [Xanthomonas citri pv. bilvae]|uniref:penicillin acylase family protein n=1 Tax=Xanthomonas citri TaxID=346 RepID=UPI000541F38C|nr:exported hypothetical protein [Xanthomonas citri pv. bilvae]